MQWQYYNPNPHSARVGDCAVRALCKALGEDWDTVYARLVSQGFAVGDMPSSNAVWGFILRKAGFVRAVPNEPCPPCYSVAQFAQEHPQGVYVLALPGHVVTIENGVLFDSWDSSGETVLYYYFK